MSKVKDSGKLQLPQDAAGCRANRTTKFTVESTLWLLELCLRAKCEAPSLWLLMLRTSGFIQIHLTSVPCV